MGVFMGRLKHFTDIKLIHIIFLRGRQENRYYFQLEFEGQCLWGRHMAVKYHV